MKVIFLDVDNVLNTIFTKVKLGKITFVDDKHLEVLKKIVDETGAIIVLSSSWRRGWWDIDNGNPTTQDALDFLALKEKLAEFGLELFDKTPIIGDTKRGYEIIEWLETHKDLNIDGIVIIDDMSSIIYPMRRYFLETSIVDGLKEKQIKRIKKILNDDLVYNKENI